ncbi:sensor domain-containing diguanylate cyclase [Lachnoclostridium sp. Marseille-P6806]|uniref:sensor domain-containing diguanylate cyclase n=1 Tax=Lachnoclostridium sp. Marseille-P6806 TaxID=2364793 RepID=UPI001031B6DD|nr:sensor domain-containing diguanylate cyclase [Lachnoclostridium sp. Marseille-P6806]
MIYDSCFRSLIENFPMGIYIVKPDRTIVFWNRAAEQITGYSAEWICGRKCPDSGLRHLDDTACPLCETYCPFMTVLKEGKELRKQVFAHHREGYHILVETIFVPIRDENGSITEVAEVFYPADQRVHSESAIEHLYNAASYDRLTGLPGRAYTEAFLRRRMSEYHLSGERFAVLFCDINDFRDFNNQYGHEAGDTVLRSFGTAMSRVCRSTDVFGRWGGDEFLGIYVIHNENDTARIAGRMQDTADALRIRHQELTLTIGLSIGITAARPEDDEASIVARADRYMYLAKRSDSQRTVTDREAGEASGGSHDG